MAVLTGGVVAPGPTQNVSETRSFTETSSSGTTYTASVTVPANAWIVDIRLYSTVLWTAATSALMKVGDAADDDGYYIGVDLKATDLLVGEVIRFASTGGKEGAYVVAATGLLNKTFSTSERVISGVVTTVTTAGQTAGRTFMVVEYTLPGAIVAAA